MAKRFKKILVLAVIFTMTVVNYGLPLQAIASSGESFFSFAFFRKNEIALDAYFGDDSEKIEEISDVNETAKITLEISPLIEGYLKSGVLKFNLENGNENNFKIQSVTVEEKDELNLDAVDSEMLDGVKKLETADETEKSSEKDVENTVSETPIKESSEDKKEDAESNTTVVEENPFSNLFKNTTAEKLAQETKKDSTEEEKLEETQNVVDDEKTETDEIVADEVEENVDSELASEENNSEAVKNNDSELVEEKEEEEKDISDVIEDVKGTYEVSLVNDNEIALKNIIDSTKIFIEVAYKQSEKINSKDLYGEIEIILEGNYINKKLETIEVTRKQELFLGWEYSKEVKVTSDFTKVSPFTVGKNSGTIIENVITITRDIEDTNFLPIKETNIKIEIPKINDKLPTAINVAANKLMATLGKELTGKEFTKDDWSFDEETGILEIKVVNEDMLAGKGEDKFDIICRYEDYLEEEIITLDKKVLVKVEEYSSDENNVQEIKIDETQEKEIIAGELMSYAVIENEEPIGKGKINANYHINAGETRFSSTVNVTVLTSDILNEVIIEPIKETYKNGDDVEFDATLEVMYAGVRFNLAEIKEMLEQGSTIDLLDANEKVFHTITKDADATKIEFAHKIDNLKIRINNVKVNGNLSIEFVKSIDKSQYSQAEFVGFEKIENIYKSSVKYVGFEDVFQLPEVKDEIKFTNTITQVNLLMSKSTLSTVYENENIEFKIDLLNNLETSDLYKNPSFELVFPSFVKEVKINNVYTLYQNGLTIRDYNVVNENGINKIILNLEGIQNGFNFSNITNGTNVIVNANIRVDEITPQKQDQIELYYCNEAVTNYQTQANWNIAKAIPEGILKDTNGYDATLFEYQSPSGMVTINSITNYDGMGSTIKSINQGEIIKTISIKGENQTATMELSVLNNTGSDSTDVVLLGRIPFKGNKDIETGNDLGTNVDTIMKSGLIADGLNSNGATIYYSSNPNADTDLNNEANGWSSTYTIFDNIKSYMIVIDGTFASGGILKYKYDFEIPANLGYEVKMLGSFGAFYNDFNVLKSSVADKVGLITESGAKYEATMSVSVGDDAEIGEARYFKYIVEVKNTGSIDLNNVVIENKKPNFASFTTTASNYDEGNDGYIESVKDVLEINLGDLKVGETKTKEILMKSATMPKTIDEYVQKIGGAPCDIDEEGNKKYYKVNEDNQKVYIEKLPEEFYVENFATVYVENTLNGVETNKVKNKLVDRNFDIDTTVFKVVEDLNVGNEFSYVIKIKNINDETINNIEVTDILPKEITYINTDVRGGESEVEFDEDTRELQVQINSLESSEISKIYVTCKADRIKNVGKTYLTNQVIVTADDDIKEEGTLIRTPIIGPELTITQETNKEENKVLETEELDIILNISNNGDGDSKPIQFDIEIPKELKIVNIISEGKRIIKHNIEENLVTANLSTLEAHDNASLIIKVMANPIAEGEANAFAEVKTKVLENHIGELEINDLSITILDNPDRELTKEEQEEIDKENTIENPTAGDGYEDDIENNRNNNSNNSDSSNSSNGNQDESQNGNHNINSNENHSINNGGNNQISSENQENSSNNINTEESVKEIKTYKISGQVFKDENKNNAQDSNEEGINKVQVMLYKGSEKVKSTLTDSLGKYRFTEIESGDYTVIFNYDSTKYIASKYKYTDVAESMNSDAIESEEGVAVTENIRLSESDVEIDLGLQERNKFDITVQKYISKAIVTTKGKEKVETYNNDTIAKLEIRSKELVDTTIELEYRIVITNEGDVNATVGTVYDYLPNSLTFDHSKNKGWEMTSGKVLINESLSKEIIKPGESKELKLVLDKVMTNNNTGTISNKVQIDNLSTDKTVEENTENNIATQEMIITVSTGRTVSVVVFIVLVMMATVVIYEIKAGKLKKAYK